MFFPVCRRPLFQLFPFAQAESLPFWYDFGCPSFFQDFLPNLLQFRCKSGILSVAFEKSYRLRAGCREMSVGARHSCGFFRRAFVSTFQAAGEESEVREQFGWQHGAYSSHLRLDGYAFFIPGEKFSYII